MKRIVYTKNDGALAIVIPVQNTNSILESLTDEQALQRAISKLPTNVSDYVVLDESAIPTDRTHRNAWVLSEDKKSIVIDQNKIQQAAAPTKEELLAQLQTLQAQIQALE